MAARKGLLSHYGEIIDKLGNTGEYGMEGYYKKRNAAESQKFQAQHDALVENTRQKKLANALRKQAVSETSGS